MAVAGLSSQFTSPAAALAAQAAAEARLELALGSATTDMLLQIKRETLSNRMTLANAGQLWENAVDTALQNVGLKATDAEYAYLAQRMLTLNLGDDAYASAQAVMTKAATTFPAPSAADIDAALDDALNLETPSLVASGRHNARDPRHRADPPPVTERVKDAASATGQGVAKVFTRGLRRVGEIWRGKVKRTVRTSFTGFSGFVALNAFRAAGVTTKTWVTRHDDKVRSTHAAADGQTVVLESPFLVGGERMQYPGDPAASMAETANCRCVLVTRG